MIKRIVVLAVIVTMVASIPELMAAQKKLAQTGFQFLSVVSDACGGAMADAMTAYPTKSNSLFFNPANMANLPNTFDVTFSQNEWIADIKHQTFSGAYRPWMGKYGVFGFSFQNVDYGDIQGTMVWGNTDGFIDTEVLNPSSFALGFGYALALSDKFAVGGQVKYVKQYYGKSVTLDREYNRDVKKYVESIMAFDFGTIFKTGFKSLTFGMSIRDFSGEAKLEEDAFQLPLMFKMGLSINTFDFVMPDQQEQVLFASIDAVHPRDYPEYVNFGLEYGLKKMLFLRGGYMLNHEEYNLTYGIGIQYMGISFDYSNTPFDEFDNIQRLTMRFSL
ncbi:MAG: PorV/PorQ family protein [Candidatus Delongbacteria bacterium]|nr:PorV/PorQ family protein [Candidatus Delongbacteria bacterium]